ncbi:MAG TPA: FxsA family protein [Actinomycetes bacterium]|jgi:UPF0716 protein FxsA|nr:FxsA family protein [Actinomycetes bacterium]
MRLSFLARLAFVLYVVIEIALFVLAGRWAGGGALALWVLATGALGIVLVRREGLRAVETVRAAVREGRAPERAGPDRGLVATGGVLLILPGLLTDLVGLVMALPPTRPLARWLLTVTAGAVVGRVTRSGAVRRPGLAGPPPGPVVRGEVVDSGDDQPG